MVSTGTAASDDSGPVDGRPEGDSGHLTEGRAVHLEAADGQAGQSASATGSATDQSASVTGPAGDRSDPSAGRTSDQPDPVSSQSNLIFSLPGQPDPLSSQTDRLPEQLDPLPEEPEPLPGQPESLTEQPRPLPEQPRPLPEQPNSLTGQLAPLPGQPEPLQGQPDHLLVQPAPLPGQPESLPGQPESLSGQSVSTSHLPVSSPGNPPPPGGQPTSTGIQPLPFISAEPITKPLPLPRSPKPPKIRITRPPRESSVFASLLPGRSRAGPVRESRAKYRTAAAPPPPPAMSGKKTAFGGDPADPTRQRSSVFDRLSRPEARSRGKSSAQYQPQPPPPPPPEETDRPRAEELYDRLITGRPLHDQPDSTSKEIAAPRATVAAAAAAAAGAEKPAAPPRLVPPLPRQPTVASITIEDETRPAPGPSTKPATAQRSSVFDRLYGAKTGRARGATKTEQADDSVPTVRGATAQAGPDAKNTKEGEGKAHPAKAARKGNLDAVKGKDTTKDTRAKKDKVAKAESDPSEDTEKKATKSDSNAVEEKKERKRDKQSSLYDRLFAGKPATSSGEHTSLVEERETAKRQEAKKRINKRKVQPKPEKRPTEVPKRAPRASTRRQGGSVFDRLYRGVPVHTTRDTDLLTPEGPGSQSRRRSSDATASDHEGAEPEPRARSKSPVKRSSSNLHMADVTLATTGEENRLHPGVLPQVKTSKAYSIFGVPVVFPGRLFGRGKRQDGDVESLPERRPQLDPSMVNTTSMARGAIPVLPRAAAYFCLLLNIFLPGLGTAVSGLLVHCMGRTRYAVETTKQDRWASTCTNFIVALMQLYTLTFCLVGWFWSVGWGVIMVTVADQHRALQGMSAEERAAQTRRTSFQQLVGGD